MNFEAIQNWSQLIKILFMVWAGVVFLWELKGISKELRKLNKKVGGEV